MIQQMLLPDPPVPRLSKSNLNIWSSWLTYCRSSIWEFWSITFHSEDECNCGSKYILLHWFSWLNENRLFQSQATAEFSKFVVIIECSTFTAASFKIWKTLHLLYSLWNSSILFSTDLPLTSLLKTGLLVILHHDVSFSLPEHVSAMYSGTPVVS